MGKTINTVGARLNAMDERARPSKVIFVITTDGMENASKEFTQVKIKEMIGHQTDVYNWKFLFLGANVDAVAVADSMGVGAAFAANYSADAAGMDKMYAAVSNVVGSLRREGKVDKKWSDSLKRKRNDNL